MGQERLQRRQAAAQLFGGFPGLLDVVDDARSDH
jgi:hypothetical protein